MRSFLLISFFVLPMVVAAQLDSGKCNVTASEQVRVHHDVFKVNYECPTDSVQLTISDRWGNIVYRSNAENLSWDGKCGEEYCATGVYVWKLIAWKQGIPVDYRGTVSIYVM